MCYHKHVNREVFVSAKKRDSALESFKLFYEEMIKVAPTSNRIRRLRQATATN